MITALSGAKVLLGHEFVSGKAVLFDQDRIASVVPEGDIPKHARRQLLDGGILAPGFMDVQVNGGGGVLLNQEPSVAALRTIGAAHRRSGTTGFLPTVITDDLATIDKAMRAVELAIEQDVPGVLGIHIEGPMLSPTRHGIHDSRHLSLPSENVLRLLGSLRTGRTVVTLAPEVVGADYISALTDAGVIVAAGHTDATFDQMQHAFAAGITGVTHLFNAMSPLGNRAPGAVGAALDDQQVWCGLIVDGVHVHPATARIAFRSRPLDRFMLVTDAMSPVGTQDTEFELQGRRMTVSGDRCSDQSGTLAGSVLTMEQAVRNCVRLVGLPVASALRLAAETPAAFLGDIERGRIAAGCKADIVWLDDNLLVRSTWIGGQEFEGDTK